VGARIQNFLGKNFSGANRGTDWGIVQCEYNGVSRVFYCGARGMSTYYFWWWWSQTVVGKRGLSRE
jgi:hypothetical protein